MSNLINWKLNLFCLNIAQNGLNTQIPVLLAYPLLAIFSILLSLKLKNFPVADLLTQMSILFYRNLKKT